MICIGLHHVYSGNYATFKMVSEDNDQKKQLHLGTGTVTLLAVKSKISNRQRFLHLQVIERRRRQRVKIQGRSSKKPPPSCCAMLIIGCPGGSVTLRYYVSCGGVLILAFYTYKTESRTRTIESLG